MRRQFVWRFGIFFFLFALFACGAFAALFWFISNTLSHDTQPDGFGFFFRPLGVVIFLAAVAVIALVFRSFRRAIVPVGDVIEAAQRVSDGDYTARVPERGPREVRGLTQAFNSMVSRLQSNDAQRRSMLADVSHELRTPLTVIQGNLEGMLDGIYPMDRPHLEPVLDETRQLSRLIEDLRTLALAEGDALQLHREPTDLAVLASETVASFRAQASANGAALRVGSPTNLPLADVDPARIRQVLENLIANALRYTARDGTILVETGVADSKYVRVSVKDSGRGISPEELPHIFERFYKTRDSRGTGLGLAITRSVIQAHGGQITATSEPDRGTEISFTLPISRET
jgi:signal transduction histidine kinase